MNSGRFFPLVMAAGILLALTGCGSSSSGSQSLVRVLNAYIPAAGASPSVSVTSGDISLTGGFLGPGAFTSGGGFVAVPDGTFNPTATGPGLPTPIQFTNPPTLNSALYTLVVAGQNGQTGTYAPQYFLVSNYTQAVLTIPPGDSAVRVVNVSANPNPVGLYATNGGTPSAPLAAQVGSVPYGFSETANQYVVVPTTDLANMAVVDSTSTGSALSLSGTSNLNSFTFRQGEAYTLYVYGQPGNDSEPFGATWVLDWPLL